MATKKSGSPNGGYSDHDDSRHPAATRLPIWETDGDGQPNVTTKYNPADFIVPGNDHQGHSERVWCRVQPLVERQVDVVLRSKKFPFRTKGDIIRWSVVHGLKVLERLEPQDNSFMSRIVVIDEIVRQEMYYYDFFQSFQNQEQLVGKHMANGAIGEARRLIALIKDQVLKMNDSPYWQSKCLNELQNKFGNILEMDKQK